MLREDIKQTLENTLPQYAGYEGQDIEIKYDWNLIIDGLFQVFEDWLGEDEV